VITVLSFLAVLMVLVMAHEVGHLVAAKKQKIAVNEFAIGFGPAIARIRKNGTDYVIRLVPLGGYVQLGEESHAGAFRHDSPCYAERPPLHKIIVALSGPAANFALAIFVFALVAFLGISSPAFMQKPADLGWVEAGSPASVAGLRAGDRIVEVDGKRITTWEELTRSFSLYERERMAVRFTRQGISGLSYLSGVSRMNLGVAPTEIVIVGSVAKNSPAALAGIEPGDTIKSIGQESILAWPQFRRTVSRARNSLLFTVVRNGQSKLISVKPHVDTASGKAIAGISYSPEQTKKSDDPVSALFHGISLTRATVTDALGTMRALLTGSLSLKALGGPVAIAQASGNTAKAGIVPLLTFLAFMSIQLGIFNLLPFIPIVDGGQVTLFLFELLRRRPIASLSLERFAKAGWATMAVLILFVTYNDVLRLL
jgi:regulator of sigma E protease